MVVENFPAVAAFQEFLEEIVVSATRGFERMLRLGT